MISMWVVHLVQHASWADWSAETEPTWEAFAEEVEHTLDGSMKVAKVRQKHVHVGMLLWGCARPMLDTDEVKNAKRDVAG